MDERKIAWLTLALIPELSPGSLWKLYRFFGGPEAILNASEDEILRNVPLKRKTAHAIAQKLTIRDPQRELEIILHSGINFTTWDDEHYPTLLRHIQNPPLFLFSKGIYRPEYAAAIAIVGTRNASARGLSFAEKLANDLAQCGVTVVSGLAVGIDSSAHRGALKAGGKTIAVMGSGLDIPYPRVNRDMIDQIAESGVVFSEYPLGTPPERWRFPSRNRIVSGLSAGVVVVEAGVKSGALITARLALEQGREVFAVPGPVYDELYAGTNKLLKEGAKLVETAKDILDEYPSWFKELSKVSLNKAQEEPASVSNEHMEDDAGDEEMKILKSITSEPQHIDKICEKTGLSCSTVLSLLTALEIKGWVRQLPGKYFIRER